MYSINILQKGGRMSIPTLPRLNELNDSIAVLKFGSSILSDLTAIPAAVNEVYHYLRKGFKIIVVVSAIGNRTNELEDSVKCLLSDSASEPEPKAFAELLSTGERTAASLFSIALDNAGIPVYQFNQPCILTKGFLLDADPILLRAEIRHLFSQHSVLVMPGFIGVNEKNELTLLGRGGSDYSAIFSAWAVNAKACVLYKDTNGIFVPGSNDNVLSQKKYKTISYQDCLDIPYPVIQHKALAFAQKEKINITVKALASKQGTLISEKKSALYEKQIHHRRKLKVILLGLGTVGYGTYCHLIKANHLFDVVGILVKNRMKHQHHPISKELLSDNIEELLKRECDVVVELIGELESSTYCITKAIQQKCHVVTANKLLLATKGLQLHALAKKNNVTLRYSAAVAGSIPILEIITHIKKGKPPQYIKSVTGILNGTSNFILEKMHQGETLERAIHLAQSAGYAESDPTFDISGQDAAHKLTIISRLAFLRKPNHLSIQGIEALSSEIIREQSPNITKLIATCSFEEDNLIASVKPIAILPSHPFASVTGAENCILIKTMDDKQIQLRGKGAGRWPTSEAVFADLLDIVLEMDTSFSHIETDQPPLRYVQNE